MALALAGHGRMHAGGGGAEYTTVALRLLLQKDIYPQKCAGGIRRLHSIGAWDKAVVLQQPTINIHVS